MNVQKFAICATGLAISVLVIPAHAGQDSTGYECRQYAEKAVQQYNESIKRGCKYTGARWNGNYETHYQWCLSIRGEYVRYNAETQVRKNGLQKCSSPGRRAGEQIGVRRY